MLKILETEHLSDVQTWVASITAAYARTVESVIAVGRELIAAKANLKHGEFERMVRRDLQFNERSAQMYMAVASCRRLCDPEIRPLLPSALSSLNTLARVEPDVWESMLAHKAVTPESTNAELSSAWDLHKVRVRGEREKPPAKLLAEVIQLPPPASAPIIEPPTVVITEPEIRSVEGELLPREPAKSAASPKERAGRTIDIGHTTGIKQYQTQGQLLRAARKYMDMVALEKPVDKVEALEWVAAYDSIVKLGL